MALPPAGAEETEPVPLAELQRHSLYEDSDFVPAVLSKGFGHEEADESEAAFFLLPSVGTWLLLRPYDLEPPDAAAEDDEAAIVRMPSRESLTSLTSTHSVMPKDAWHAIHSLFPRICGLVGRQETKKKEVEVAQASAATVPSQPPGPSQTQQTAGGAPATAKDISTAIPTCLIEGNDKFSRPFADDDPADLQVPPLTTSISPLAFRSPGGADPAQSAVTQRPSSPKIPGIAPRVIEPAKASEEPGRGAASKIADRKVEQPLAGNEVPDPQPQPSRRPMEAADSKPGQKTPPVPSAKEEARPERDLQPERGRPKSVAAPPTTSTQSSSAGGVQAQAKFPTSSVKAAVEPSPGVSTSSMPTSNATSSAPVTLHDRSSPLPGSRAFVVSVPHPHPGIQYRRSKNFNDRMKDYVANGTKVYGVVENAGDWLCLGEGVYIPTRIDKIILLRPDPRDADAVLVDGPASNSAQAEAADGSRVRSRDAPPGVGRMPTGGANSRQSQDGNWGLFLSWCSACQDQSQTEVEVPPLNRSRGGAPGVVGGGGAPGVVGGGSGGGFGSYTRESR